MLLLRIQQEQEVSVEQGQADTYLGDIVTISRPSGQVYTGTVEHNNREYITVSTPRTGRGGRPLHPLVRKPWRVWITEVRRGGKVIWSKAE
jgi:hypothetical protein